MPRGRERSDRQQEFVPADGIALGDCAAGLVAQVEAHAVAAGYGQGHRGRGAIDDHGTRVRHVAREADEGLHVAYGVGELAERAGVARHREIGRTGNGGAARIAGHREVAQRAGGDGGAGALLRRLQRAARDRDRAAGRAALVHRDLHVAIHVRRFVAAGDAEVVVTGVERGGPDPRIQDVAADVGEGGAHAAADDVAVFDAAVGDDDHGVAVADRLLVAQGGFDGERAAAAAWLGEGQAGQHLSCAAGVGALDQVQRRGHRADGRAIDADAGQCAAEGCGRFADRAGGRVSIRGDAGRVGGRDRRQRRSLDWGRSRSRAAAAAATATACRQQQGRANAQEEGMFFHQVLSFSGQLLL